MNIALATEKSKTFKLEKKNNPTAPPIATLRSSFN